MDFNPQSFTGLLVKGPQGKDYIRGVNSPLKPIIVLPSGDWTPYVPIGERQSGNGFDTNDCTGFSYTNVAEVQIIYYIRNKMLSVEALQFLSDNGYLDQNGEPNFSDRALGSMAGTTSNGNYLQTVAETARTKGLVPESKWPSVFTNYDEYYKAVPQELLDLGQQFLKYFSLPYEWCSGTAEDLSHAPMYVALCTCGGWNTPPVAWCNAGDATNHAVCKLNNSPAIFDSYSPYVKQLSGDYHIPYQMKVIVMPQELNITKKFLIQDGAKVGVLILEGFTGTVAFADTPAHLQELKDAFNVPDGTPTIQVPQ